MKINNLYKVGIKDNHKIREIEDYLEREIGDILDKRRFDDDYDHNHNHNHHNHRFSFDNEPEINRRSRNFNHREYDNSQSEDYLPFNKEELRPVIRDTINNGRIENLIMDSLMPNIEEWLDDNLERVVYRVVKRHIAKRAMLQERENREERNERRISSTRRRTTTRYDR